MKKFLSIFLLATIVLSVVIGCGHQELKNKNSGEVLYTLTDVTGTRISFYEKPHRIISLNVSIDEILLDLIASERLLALSRIADDTSICSAGAKVKSVKGRLGSNDLESILALQPDLVLLPDYNMDAVRGLRSTGLKVYVCHTPNNMHEIAIFIKEIANVVGEAEAGDKMVQEFESKLNFIKNKVETAIPPQERLKVLCLSFTGPIGSKGTFSDICHYSGTKNALEGIDIPYQSNLSEEKMLELNPDVIITPSWDYSKQGDPEKFRQKILHNPVYKDLNAVKNGKVVRLHDNYLYSTSQYSVKAVEELAKAAYPEVFR